jgi:hypothetical protein
MNKVIGPEEPVLGFQTQRMGVHLDITNSHQDDPMKALENRSNRPTQDFDEVEELLSIKETSSRRKRSHVPDASGEYFEFSRINFDPPQLLPCSGKAFESSENSRLACPSQSALDLSRRDSESELVKYLMAKGGRVDSEIR